MILVHVKRKHGEGGGERTMRYVNQCTVNPPGSNEVWSSVFDSNIRVFSQGSRSEK